MGAPRIQAAGSPTGMISDALDAARRRAVQAELGFDASTLSHWCDPAETNGRRMPVSALHEVAVLSPAAALVAARHFAALAGAEVRELREDDGSLSSAVAALLRATGEIGAHMLEATDPAGPGGAGFTPAELRRLQADLDLAAESIATARARFAREASS
ncbi:hypothetical protein [Albimonas pacifica]|uniref:Uncharacterized protein n=1 Tax=Albimonas pacifica TaxID=1114924 RepID=A0A1I3HJM1_9RHOB|nr:hypothetical protein [Albimonas pacifica]SFI35882.1 hypothetical protein SAMN05216258_10631 [Albimonas pacifica]